LPFGGGINDGFFWAETLFLRNPRRKRERKSGGRKSDRGSNVERKGDEIEGKKRGYERRKKERENLGGGRVGDEIKRNGLGEKEG